MSDQLSKVFAALADPTRRDIVARLSAGDATVNAIAAPYEVSLQAVSKHLKVLEDAGLVSRSREAQRRPVHLEAEVFDLMTKWIERYQRRAEERFQRLDAVLAGLDEHGDPCRSTTSTTHDRQRPAHGRTGIMTTTRTQARIEADEKVPMIHIYRDFAATPAQLFRAHTDPELFARWVGPTDIGADIDYWDARDGGAWRYTASRGGEFDAGLPRLLPHGEPRADRADLHLGGHARGRGPGDADLRGPRRRAHPPARDEPVRLVRGPRRLAGQRHGDRCRTTATPRSTALLEAGEL